MTMSSFDSTKRLLPEILAEIVKGSPVSEKTMEIGQRLGLAVLLGLTFFAFYNDINRLFTG